MAGNGSELVCDQEKKVTRWFGSHCFDWLTVGYIPACCVSVRLCRKSDSEAADICGVGVGPTIVYDPSGAWSMLPKRQWMYMFGDHPGSTVLSSVCTVQLRCFHHNQGHGHSPSYLSRRCWLLHCLYYRLIDYLPWECFNHGRWCPELTSTVLSRDSLVGKGTIYQS